MNQQTLTLQVSAKALLTVAVGAVVAIPMTILATIWLLQPDAVSAGEFSQNANTGTVYQLPAGSAVVPAGSMGGSCAVPAEDGEHAHGDHAFAPASAGGAWYSVPGSTGSVTQNQSETNINTSNWTNNESYSAVISVSDSFNPGSNNGNNSNNGNTDDSYNDNEIGNTDVEIDVDVEDNNFNSNNDNEQSIVGDDNENTSTEVDDAIGVIIANGTIED